MAKHRWVEPIGHNPEKPNDSSRTQGETTESQPLRRQHRFNICRYVQVPDISQQHTIQMQLAELALADPFLSQGRLVQPGQFLLPILSGRQLNRYMKKSGSDETLYATLKKVEKNLGGQASKAVRVCCTPRFVHDFPEGMDPLLHIQGDSNEIRSNRLAAARQFYEITELDPYMPDPRSTTRIELAAFPIDPHNAQRDNRRELTWRANQTITPPKEYIYGRMEIVDLEAYGQYRLPLQDFIGNPA